MPYCIYSFPDNRSEVLFPPEVVLFVDDLTSYFSKKN